MGGGGGGDERAAAPAPQALPRPSRAPALARRACLRRRSLTPPRPWRAAPRRPPPPCASRSAPGSPAAALASARGSGSSGEDACPRGAEELAGGRGHGPQAPRSEAQCCPRGCSGALPRRSPRPAPSPPLPSALEADRRPKREVPCRRGRARMWGRDLGPRLTQAGVRSRSPRRWKLSASVSLPSRSPRPPPPSGLTLGREEAGSDCLGLALDLKKRGEPYFCGHHPSDQMTSTVDKASP
ncbi:translation initiation factor IF-2-like [Panthera uncia]|uniref:translation initiation factor IF-2-like n=1 Tax=Panthera uncia TaxID=29064 RepID=UPI0020FFACCC|nr:translation initiation factor IF-2-like [Panthera uncia]